MVSWYDRLGIPDDALVVEDGRATVIASRSLPAGFAERVANVRFGTAGLYYRRLDVLAELQRLHNPVFFALLVDGSVAGTYVLNLRTLVLRDGESILGVYRSSLSVVDEHSAQGLGRWFAEQSLQWLSERCRAVSQSALSWGCIEARNERSLKAIVAAGGEELGRLESLLVYRQWPRARLSVSEPTADQHTRLQALMSRAVSDCGPRPEPIIDRFYKVAELSGKRLIGARVVSERVCLERIGGFWDSLYRYLLRYSGAARRRFDPANFHYLRISDLALDASTASELPDFLASLMAAEGSHMAMFVLDRCSQLAVDLHDLGLFGRFATATRTEIVVMGRVLCGDGVPVKSVQKSPLALTPLTG